MTSNKATTNVRENGSNEATFTSFLLNYPIFNHKLGEIVQLLTVLYRKRGVVEKIGQWCSVKVWPIFPPPPPPVFEVTTQSKWTYKRTYKWTWIKKNLQYLFYCLNESISAQVFAKNCVSLIHSQPLQLFPLILELSEIKQCLSYQLYFEKDWLSVKLRFWTQKS